MSLFHKQMTVCESLRPIHRTRSLNFSKRLLRKVPIFLNPVPNSRATLGSAPLNMTPRTKSFSNSRVFNSKTEPSRNSWKVFFQHRLLHPVSALRFFLSTPHRRGERKKD